MSVVWRRRSRPVRTAVLSLNASSDAAVWATCSLKIGESASTGAPTSSAEAIVGELAAICCTPGLQRGEQVGAVLEERADDREGALAGLERGRRLGDRLLDVGPRDLGECGERGVHVDEHLRLDLGDRRHLGGGVRAGDDEALELRVRRGEVLHHRLQQRDRLGQLAEGGVELGTAAGERVAELDEVLLDRDPGRLVERAQHLVDLDRLGVAAESGTTEPAS